MRPLTGESITYPHTLIHPRAHNHTHLCMYVCMQKLLRYFSRYTSGFVFRVRILTVSGGDAPVLKLWGLCNTLSLLLFPDSLKSGVVVGVRVPSMGQIDLCKKTLAFDWNT